jgi:hypothetical protein
MEHYRAEVPPAGTPVTWPGPELRVALPAEVPPAPTWERIAPDLETPLAFSPEPAPYQLVFPSQLAESGLKAAAAASGAEDGDLPRLRGEIIHRGLETVARGGELPGAAGLAAALRQAGLDPETAAQLAPELLAELAACRRDPWLARFIDPEQQGVSEWLLEDLAGPTTLRRGKIDRLAFDGESWWILDYKTSRPEPPEAWEEFIRQEVEKYRPQLLAYREMAARAKGLAPQEIKLALYFTACRRAVEI